MNYTIQRTTRCERNYISLTDTKSKADVVVEYSDATATARTLVFALIGYATVKLGLSLSQIAIADDLQSEIQ